jgi:hypothetical protein
MVPHMLEAVFFGVRGWRQLLSTGWMELAQHDNIAECLKN